MYFAHKSEAADDEKDDIARNHMCLDDKNVSEIGYDGLKPGKRLTYCERDYM